MASSSTSSFPKSFKYDVFLSFRGEDTRTNFIDHLYSALEQKSIYTYKDDERIKKGKRISDELIRSIEDSRFYIIVFSKNYASSSWCMDELVKIMECHKTSEHTAYPVFYDVEPSEVRKQIGAVGEAFTNHEKQEAAGKWREALKEAADLAGWELKKTADGHEAKFIKRIVEEVSLELRTINFYIDENLVGMETRINDILSSLGTDYDDVHMIGIWGMGGGGKTTLARAIFNKISFQFEGKSFIENVREVSNASLSGLKSLQSKILSDVLNDKCMNVDTEYEGKNMMRRMMRCKKVVIVLDDVDHIDQLEALAGDRNWFKPGSIIIITTREQQVLVAHGVKIHNVNLLSDKEAIGLFGRYAFRREIPQGYEELSRQVVRYAAGLPLTIKVLGSFLCGKSILDWVDALDRIKTVPLEETRKKLELSYIGLDDDYKEIFLDVATILKGWTKDSTLKALESCGFHAKIGLRVLQQKSLINFYHGYDDEECVGMHDHLEEMGRNIVRRSHPDMPNKHSRLWDSKEIEDVLANDLGTEATRCVKFCDREINPETVMRGLRKMRELRFLDVFSYKQHVYLKQTVYSNLKINEVIQKFLKAVEYLFNWKFNQVDSYLPNALRYLRWSRYPFPYLPKTFQANDLGALEMDDSHIVELWEGGERKVLNKLRFLYLSGPQLRTFDLRLTPNLETMRLERQRNGDLVELYLPGECLKLRSLILDGIKLRKFNLGMTPNLENLTLNGCELVELHMSGKCLNLTYLKLYESNLRTLDIGLTPNLEKIWLHNCHDLEELHMPHECLKLMSLKLRGLKLRTLDLGRTPSLEELNLYACNDLEELHMAQCVKLKNLKLVGSKLRTFDLRLTPNLKKLSLKFCALEELHMAHEYVKLTSIKLECLNLRTLDLGPSPMLTFINIWNLDLRTLDVSQVPNLHVLFISECNLVELHLPSRSIKLNSLSCTDSMLRTLDLGLTPNLKELNLTGCHNLVELHIPIGCLKNIVYLELNACLAFTSFLFRLKDRTFGIENESLQLHFTLKSCPFHPDNNSLKFDFTCFHRDDLPSLTTSIEELISVGPCACTKLEGFSRSICRLQRTNIIKLKTQS